MTYLYLPAELVVCSMTYLYLPAELVVCSMTYLYLLAELVVWALDKLELLQGYPYWLEHGLDDPLIVLNPQTQQFPGGLHVVEVGMQIGKQNSYLKKKRKDTKLTIRKQQSLVILFKYYTCIHVHCICTILTVTRDLIASSDCLYQLISYHFISV